MCLSKLRECTKKVRFVENMNTPPYFLGTFYLSKLLDFPPSYEGDVAQEHDVPQVVVVDV